MQNAKHPQKGPQQRGISSTLDILGTTNGRMVRGKWAEHHQRLTELRDQLVEERRVQSQSAQEEVNFLTEHMADAASDSYDRDCALALLSSTQTALYEIDQALNRIAHGSYGMCEQTGEPIESERLKTIPWTRFSKAAQMQLEAKGMSNRVQLGELGSLNGTSTDEADEDEEGTVARSETEVA